MYVQDKMEEYADELYDRMEKGAHMYFCGLKGTYIVLYKYSFMLDIDVLMCRNDARDIGDVTRSGREERISLD